MQKNHADLQLIDGFSILFNVEPMMRAKMTRSLHLKLNDAQFKSIELLLNERKQQGRFISPEVGLINTGYLLILISKLCGIYVENSSAKKENEKVKDEDFMRSLALIHERYNEKLTLDQLAAEAKLSKSTYTRRFMYICKTSPAEYITRKRIEIAEGMLRSTDASLMDIAERVGFYDTAHFSRTFKRVCGISPSRYRAENKF
jgi:AraC-like DNA-binding protein